MSIVFLAYNRRAELAKSLEHVLRDLDYPADRLEILVVDNASQDGTAEMVRDRFPGVQLIRSPENVGASAWNVGMTTARGDWRMILDDDCYLTGPALRTAVTRAEEHRADFVSFRVMSEVDPEYSFNDEHPVGLLAFWGCAAMFSARVIEQEPFYDPAIFIWANEMELTMRLLDRGFRHLYLPEVQPVHMKAPTVAFHDLAVRTNHHNYAYIAGKHMAPRDALGAFVNLLVHLVLQGISEDRRAWGALPLVPKGFLTGLRSRQPVRAEVSRVYRMHVRNFLSPVRLLRTPLQRLRDSAGPDRHRSRRSRIDGWYARRPRYYPDSAASLEL